jgi:hypothetical protein
MIGVAFSLLKADLYSLIPLSVVANSHYGAAQGGRRHSRYQKLTSEALRRQIDSTARQAMTVVSLELRARYGAWFRCAGDS